ncbi:unnamed protein product [Victoria cruziana]
MSSLQGAETDTRDPTYPRSSIYGDLPGFYSFFRNNICHWCTSIPTLLFCMRCENQSSLLSTAFYSSSTLVCNVHPHQQVCLLSLCMSGPI